MKDRHHNLNRLTGSNTCFFQIIISAFLSLFIALLVGCSSNNASSIPVKQLETIKAGEIEKAYTYMSTAFQQQSSLAAFITFVNQYPILQEFKNVNFTENKIDKVNALLTGTLEGADNRKMVIEYQLIKESNGWKVQSIRLAPMSAVAQMTHDNTGATIRNIMVSETADADGYVTKGKTTVPALASKVYVTVQINTPKAGGKIEATVIETASGQKYGPSQDDISQAGNLLKAFSFTRVSNAWTVGQYQILVKLSSGDTKSIAFEIQ
jgi:hypothetical protein